MKLLQVRESEAEFRGWSRREGEREEGEMERAEGEASKMKKDCCDMTPSQESQTFHPELAEGPERVGSLRQLVKTQLTV